MVVASRPKDALEETDALTLSQAAVLSISSQINDLKQLKDGWFNGDGKVVSAEGWDWVEKHLNSYFADMPTPYLYPTIEGGIRVEWSVGNNGWEVSLDINPAEQTGYWHAFRLRDDMTEEQSLNLNDPRQWGWISEQILLKEGQV